MGKRSVFSSDFRLNKRAKSKQSVEDSLSELPDEILSFIISFLTVKEAATTCILSKRWKYLWKFTTRLNFDATPALDRIVAADVNNDLRLKESRKYVEWVNQVLKLHGSSKLEKFRVCFDLRKAYKKSLRRWIKHAYDTGVESLELDLLQISHNYKEYYKFPDSLGFCTRKLLQKPYSDYCGFHSLKDLRLKCVNVSRQIVEYFLHNCPLLEYLVVHRSGDLLNLTVTGQSLKLIHLEICNCPRSKFIKVSDANIVSLVVEHSGKLELHNVPMLVKVSVTGQDSQSYYRGDDVFSQFSCCFSQLEVLELRLRPRVIEKMRLHEIPVLIKLKKLVLTTETYGDQYLLGITTLMRACPFLEKIVLKLLNFSSLTGRKRVERTNECTLQHLKVVEWLGYFGHVRELEILTYILKNAVSLQKIIIDPTDQWFFGKLVTDYDRNKAQAARRRVMDQIQLVPEHVELVFVWDEAKWQNKKEGDFGA